MNSSRTLKVTVNGKKYLITGIEKETSCKDLLCAIAKVTQKTVENIKEELKEEKSLRGRYSVNTSELKCEENLLEQFKGDRKLVGDYKSLSVFNSLGENAKIIVKEKSTFEKDIRVDELAKVCKKKKRKEKTKDIKHKFEEHDRKSHKHKNKKHTGKYFECDVTSKVNTRVSRKHRSVDDSDIDSYKQDTLTRLKKRKSRAHDDLDIDVYQNLFSIVLDQNKTLNKLQSQSKEVKKTAWINELRRTSQVYYIDDENSHEIITEKRNMETRVFEKDDGNDSGLPSPEYDSSESQEHQPISTLRRRSRELLNNKEILKTSPQVTDSVLKENVVKDKQSFTSNQNNSTQNHNKLEKDCNSLPNDQSVNTQNENKLNKTFVVKINQNHKLKVNNKNDQINKTQATEDLNQSQEESENLMSQITVTTVNSLKNNFVGDISRNNVILDCNENVITKTTSEGEATRMMVAFDAALLQQSAAQNNKKLEKKKIKKTDISDPVLLTTSTYKRHKSLKKVETLLGLQTADVLREEMLISKSQTVEEEKKEKEKFYNKKLKEIRRSMRLKNSKSTTEPEYSSKEIFGEEKRERVEVLEVNVFEKKTKNKNKNKKAKNNEGKSKSKKEEEKKTVQSKTKETKIQSLEENNKQKNDKDTGTAKDNDEKIVNDITHTNKQETLEVDAKIEHDHIITTSRENQQNKDETYSNETEQMKTNSRATCDNKNIESLPNCENNNSDDQISRKSSSSSVTFLPTQNNRSSIISESSATRSELDSSSDDEEMKRQELILIYQQEKQNLDELAQRLLDYNLMISQLREEFEILVDEKHKNETFEDLEKEERDIYKEMENIRSLLRSVTDLTTYQRKEMSQNLTLLDQLDIDVRTKKAGYENLKSGNWKTSAQLAPRWLIKKHKAQNGTPSNKQRGSSFV